MPGSSTARSGGANAASRDCAICGELAASFDINHGANSWRAMASSISCLPTFGMKSLADLARYSVPNAVDTGGRSCIPNARSTGLMAVLLKASAATEGMLITPLIKPAEPAAMEPSSGFSSANLRRPSASAIWLVTPLISSTRRPSSATRTPCVSMRRSAICLAVRPSMTSLMPGNTSGTGTGGGAAPAPGRGGGRLPGPRGASSSR